MCQQAAAGAPTHIECLSDSEWLDYGTSTGTSLAQFIQSYALPGSINSTSIRFDHTFFPKLSSFFRFSNTSSSTATRAESVLTSLKFNTRTYTLGATSSFSQALVNEFRLGFSHSDAANARVVDGSGGAQPINWS
jgi:hypothetical protein